MGAGVDVPAGIAVLAPVAGRALALSAVADPVFAQNMVGVGAAVDPPRRVVQALAPVTGRLLRLMPHAYVVLTAGSVGVLVHLGLDTVTLKGGGFTALAAQGDDVVAGQPVIAYDVAAVAATGLDPVVPVVIVDRRDPGTVVASDAVSRGVEIDAGAVLFTA